MTFDFTEVVKPDQALKDKQTLFNEIDFKIQENVDPTLFAFVSSLIGF